MRKAEIVPMGSNVFAVRVDSYSDGNIEGRFFGPMMEAPVQFKSTVDLIIMIDELLDQEDEQGAFEPVANAADLIEFSPNFELEVLFRQNSSWQGRISFLDIKREARFRSVLELLIILETTLSD